MKAKECPGCQTGIVVNDNQDANYCFSCGMFIRATLAKTDLPFELPEAKAKRPVDINELIKSGKELPEDIKKTLINLHDLLQEIKESYLPEEKTTNRNETKGILQSISEDNEDLSFREELDNPMWFEKFKKL